MRELYGIIRIYVGNLNYFVFSLHLGFTYFVLRMAHDYLWRYIYAEL